MVNFGASKLEWGAHFLDPLDLHMKVIIGHIFYWVSIVDMY